jgi:peroxiredoxin (alkyl hydroperoxide reductase subunit C)
MSFTPVSTSEIINASRYYPEFTKRNAQFISLTTDNIFANLNWVYDVYLKTGIHVPFPVISDSDKEISQLYGMMNIDRTYEESVRDAFIINPEGKIMSILTLPITCGRSGYELTRILDSLQLTANHNLYTPADWTPGDPAIVPPPANYEALTKSVETSASTGLQCPFWYLCLQNTNTVENSDTAAQQNFCPKQQKHI